MNHIQAIAIFLGILVAGLMLFYSAMFLAEMLMHKKISVRSIFKNFRQKMWMTTGLGFLFFGFYVFLVFLGAYITRMIGHIHLFNLLHKHPVAFIYIGLLTFALISVSIYLARIVIKYVYNSRRRE
jgi:hypothetical protein